MVDDSLSLYPSKAVTKQYPAIFSIGASKQYPEALLSIDLSTGFSDDFGVSKRWRLSTGVEITRFEYTPIRFGLGLGGKSYYDFSFGWGYDFGMINLDFGLALRQGLTISSARGYGMSFALSYGL